MNRSRLIALGLGLLPLLAAILVWQARQPPPATAETPTPGNTLEKERATSGEQVAVGESKTSGPPWKKQVGEKGTSVPAPGDLALAHEHEREKPMEPAEGSSLEPASVTVKTRVGKGETLVTGGYLRKDGLYEISMVKPELVPNEAGGNLVVFSTKLIALEQSAFEENELGSILTDARQTQQHGEIWAAGEDEAFNKKLSNLADTRSHMISAPTVMTHPGAAATIEIGDAEFEIYFLELKGNPTEDGGFDIESKVVRGKKMPAELRESFPAQP